MKKHIKFTDRAIANLRHSDYEFTYVAKDGSTKTRKQIEITVKRKKINKTKNTFLINVIILRRLRV